MTASKPVNMRQRQGLGWQAARFWVKAARLCREFCNLADDQFEHEFCFVVATMQNLQSKSKSHKAQGHISMTRPARQGLSLLLSKAQALQQQGQLVEAINLYEQILHADPDSFDALLQMGIICFQLNNPALAEDLFSKAIEVNPRHAAVNSNRGLALQLLGRLEEAVECYDRATALKPDYALAFYNRGNALKDLDRTTEALASYDKAIRHQPHFPQAYSNRGDVLKELGRIDEAVSSYKKAIKLKPDFDLAYTNLGIALMAQKLYEEAIISFDKSLGIQPNHAATHLCRGNALRKLHRLEEALDSFDRAITLAPSYAEAFSDRGVVLKELKRLEDAVASYDIAIAIKQDFAEAFSNRGNALNELKRYEDAVTSFDVAIKLKPILAEAFSNRGVALFNLDRQSESVKSFEEAIILSSENAEAHSNKGLALQKLQKLEDAVKSYDLAISIKPDYAEAYSNRGTVLLEMMRVNEAIDSYNKAISIDEKFTPAYWNKSIALLLSGEFSSGWDFYDYGLNDIKMRGVSFKSIKPRWTGKEDLDGKSILLYSEQGLGDTLQFCRYVEIVKNLGAKVLLVVQKPLENFLRDLAGVDQLIDLDKPLPEYDFHCPLLSLPRAFRTTIENIPSSNSYLKSDINKRDLMAKKLGPKTMPRIGLVWSGNPDHSNDRNRSILLSDLISRLPLGFEYVSLQKEVRERDKDVLSKSQVRVFAEELKDFADTAALCDMMDAVISVDTSVAHLSAGLGKPTNILLPYVPDWRWLLGRDDSPWYRSVKLYRQSEARNYEFTLDKLRVDLVNKFKLCHLSLI